MERKIKLNVTLKYGVDENQFYKSGSELGRGHFPEDLFKEDPDRVMAGLVSSGSATWVQPEEAPVPETPKSKSSDNSDPVKKKT